MPEDIYQKFISKKAFEISYALFRISSVLPHKSFGKELEDRALSLLTSSISGDYKESLRTLDLIISIARLAGDLNIISGANSGIVIKEASYLNSAIAEFINSARLPDLEISDIFSSKQPSFSESGTAVKKEADSNDILENTDEYSPQLEASNAAQKMEMRQSAILERIRQNGNFTLKDVQGFLPGVSERTVRYDMHSLAEKGLVERIGSGGPGTYYRAKMDGQI